MLKKRVQIITKNGYDVGSVELDSISLGDALEKFSQSLNPILVAFQEKTAYIDMQTLVYDIFYHPTHERNIKIQFHNLDIARYEFLELVSWVGDFAAQNLGLIWVDFDYELSYILITSLKKLTAQEEYIVESARTSYAAENKSDEDNLRILKYLIKNRHEVPLEHIIFTFDLELPMAIAVHFLKHRIASHSQQSRRYDNDNWDFYIPDLRMQDVKNKQKSSKYLRDTNLELADTLEEKIVSHYHNSLQLYAELIENGIAKEHARFVIPTSHMSRMRLTINARSMLNLIKLRTSEHAQYETRLLAEQMATVFKFYLPNVYEVYFDVKGNT